MTRSRASSCSSVFTLVFALLALAAPAQSQAPKSGGTLNIMLREDLSQGFAIHESSTISTVFPAAPCLNNLVQFDPANHQTRRCADG